MLVENLYHKQLDKSPNVKGLLALYVQDHVQKGEPQCCSKLKNMVTKNSIRKPARSTALHNASAYMTRGHLQLWSEVTLARNKETGFSGSRKDYARVGATCHFKHDVHNQVKEKGRPRSEERSRGPSPRKEPSPAKGNLKTGRSPSGKQTQPTHLKFFKK